MEFEHALLYLNLDPDHHLCTTMSLPAREYDPRKIFLISCPSLPFFKHRRAAGTYLSGALVSFSSDFPIFLAFKPSPLHLSTFQMLTHSSLSSLPSPGESSLTLAHSVATSSSQNPTFHPYMLNSSIGFQEFSLLLVCSSST